MTTRCRPHRSPAPAPDLDPVQLTSLLEGILANWLPELGSVPPELGHLEALSLGGPEPVELPLAVGVVSADCDTIELALHPLWGPEPVGDLFGFVAPPTWLAFGVVASGTARALAGASPSPGADQAVLVGFLVSRRGQCAHLTWSAGALGRSSQAPGGRIPDACRRSLGLPTDDPQAPVIELWATLWLERVLVDLLAEPRSPSWTQLAWSFPAFGVLSGCDPAATVTVDSLVAVGHAAQLWGWGELRRLQAAGTTSSFGITPADAQWMDDGMFSREALGALPGLRELVVDLAELLAPTVADDVERALQAWGLT